MWEQVKRAIVDSGGEVCGLVRMGGGGLWRNDVVKGAAERKQAAWREVWELGMRLQNTDV